MTLLDRGGVLIVKDLLDASLFQELSADATERRSSAERFVTTSSELTDGRGGNPARSYWAVSAGPIQHHIFGSDTCLETLSNLTGLQLQAAGPGSYTYYEPGDFLDLHLDVVRCDLAAITCLEDNGPELRGGLRVYRESLHRPLHEVRSDRSRGTFLPMQAGDTILLAGGVVPHEVTRTVDGQRRHVALACFQMTLL